MRKLSKKRPRRTHSPQFKAEVVQLVRSGARTVAEASRELGLADSLIRRWLEGSDSESGADKSAVLTASEKEELSHLRREVKVLRMEREILKKAATFFAKENA
jgi:transposase-like protein